MPFPNVVSLDNGYYTYNPPFEFSGILYAVGYEQDPVIGFFTLHVFRSIDQGDTWSLVGGDGPEISNGGPTFCAVTDGINLIVVHEDRATTNLAVTIFDIASNAWGISTITDQVGTWCTHPGVAYRSASNTLVVLGVASNFADQTAYLIYDLAGASWTPWIVLLGDAGFAIPNQIVVGNGGVHLISHATVAAVGTLQLFQQFLDDSDVLGALQVIEDFGVDGDIDPTSVSTSCDGTTLCVGWIPHLTTDPPDTSNPIRYFSGPSVETVVFVPQVVPIPDGGITLWFGISFLGTDVYLSTNYYVPPFLSATEQIFVYAVDSGAGFGAFIEFGTSVTLLGGSYISSAAVLSSIGFLFGGSIYFWLLGGAPPPATSISRLAMGGGTFFPRYINLTFLLNQLARQSPPLSSFFLFPNEYDICLSRDWSLYERIDRELMSCASKPGCFCQSEREWVETPKGGATFNPNGAIPLPAALSGDVIIFSFKVPLGYDGIITAQYHGYTEPFTEGSGDLAWRIRVDGRYLRDCGDVLMTLGTSRTLSPVEGGLQLRSGNLVEYIVSAPNTSGLLPPPGTGNILAGLHGWFYPRK